MNVPSNRIQGLAQKCKLTGITQDQKAETPEDGKILQN